MVLERYGTFAAANAETKRLVAEAFVRTTRAAFAHGASACAEGAPASRALIRGGRALHDERIVRLYEDKLAEIARPASNAP